MEVSITDFGGQVWDSARCSTAVGMLCQVVPYVRSRSQSHLLTPCDPCMQEVYQQTHPVLFSDRAIYVIVYSLRTEVSMVELQRHLMNVTIRCKEAPIILVGTHSDAIGGNPNLPLPALKARYPQVCFFLHILLWCIVFNL